MTLIAQSKLRAVHSHTNLTLPSSRHSLSSASSACRPLLPPRLALLLSFPVALFSIAMLTDIPCLQTTEDQWMHFSLSLMVGRSCSAGWRLCGA